MRLLLNEQEVKDGACVFTADALDCEPEDIHVDLYFDEKKGFWAEGKRGVFGRGKVHMNEQEMMDGIAMFLHEYHCYEPEVLTLRLNFDKSTGITAEVAVNEPL